MIIYIMPMLYLYIYLYILLLLLYIYVSYYVYVSVCVPMPTITTQHAAIVLGHIIWRFSGITNSPAAETRGKRWKQPNTLWFLIVFMMAKRWKYLINSEFHNGKTMGTSCFDGFYPHVCGCRSKTLGTWPAHWKPTLQPMEVYPWHWEC